MALAVYDEAEQDFAAAAAGAPDWAEAYYWLGNARFRLGRYAEALSSYDAAIERGPEEALAYHARALTYVHLERPEEAIVDLRRVLELTQNPNLVASAQAQLRELGVE